MTTDTIVYDGQEEQRVDLFLTQRFDDYSRAYFQERLNAGDVLVNGEPVKKRYQLQLGDVVSIAWSISSERSELKPQNIPIHVLYENEDLLVVNKPMGMVVHPALGNWQGTLVNALMYHYPACFALDDQNERPGIVHRLDKDTTGVIVVAKNRQTLTVLQDAFAKREVIKDYLAIVHQPPTVWDDIRINETSPKGS